MFSDFVPNEESLVSRNFLRVGTAHFRRSYGRVMESRLLFSGAMEKFGLILFLSQIATV